MSNTVTDLTVVPGGSLATNEREVVAGQIMESVIIKGDLAKLSPTERVNYYNGVCQSVGLNPLTRPFEYINLSGKLTLYARKDATEQLREKHSISLNILSRDYDNDTGLYEVHVAATMPNGRRDEDMGAVYIKGLQGEARANGVLKAITKAKRRTTLSICGLGWTDESEIDSIPGAQTVSVNHETGEIEGTTPASDSIKSPADYTEPESDARAEWQGLCDRLIGYMGRLRKADLAAYRQLLAETYGVTNPKRLKTASLRERVDDFEGGTEWAALLDLSEPAPESPQSPPPPPPADEPPFDADEPAHEGEFRDEAPALGPVPAAQPAAPAPAAKATTENVARAGQQAQADAKARVDLQLLIGDIEKLGYVGLRKTAFTEYVQSAGIESIKRKAATATVLRELAGVLIGNMDPFEVETEELDALKTKARGLGVTWEGS